MAKRNIFIGISRLRMWVWLGIFPDCTPFSLPRWLLCNMFSLKVGIVSNLEEHYIWCETAE